MRKNKPKPISLWFLFVITFLAQMVAGVVGIAVPIYANLLGASPFLVGLVGASGGLIYTFMPLVFGKLSDKLNRKSFISASLILYGFSCLLYYFIEEPLILILVKVLEWLSIATFWPSLEAKLADAADEELEEVLKKFNISWGSAMVVGPIIGGALISVYSVKASFLFSLLVSFPSGLLSFVIVKETPRKSDADPRPPVELRNNTTNDHTFITALSSIFLFSTIGGISLSLFPSYATDLGIPPHEIGLITFAMGTSRTIAFYHANRIESRFGKWGMFPVGSAILAIGSFLTINSHSTVMFLISFLVLGFGSGISYAASISFILRRRGMSRGYAAGLFESLIGIGYFAGPLIGGTAMEYDPAAPFILSFVFSLVTFTVQMFSWRSHDFRDTCGLST